MVRNIRPPTHEETTGSFLTMDLDGFMARLRDDVKPIVSSDVAHDTGVCQWLATAPGQHPAVPEPGYVSARAGNAGGNVVAALVVGGCITRIARERDCERARRNTSG